MESSIPASAYLDGAVVQVAIHDEVLDAALALIPAVAVQAATRFAVSPLGEPGAARILARALDEIRFAVPAWAGIRFAVLALDETRSAAVAQDAIRPADALPEQVWIPDDCPARSCIPVPFSTEDGSRCAMGSPSLPAALVGALRELRFDLALCRLHCDRHLPVSPLQQSEDDRCLLLRKMCDSIALPESPAAAPAWERCAGQSWLFSPPVSDRDVHLRGRLCKRRVCRSRLWCYAPPSHSRTCCAPQWDPPA